MQTEALEVAFLINSLMKRKTLLFISFLFLNFVVFSQNFAPIGATWHYTEFQAFSNNQSFFKIESKKDSVFQGKNCRFLEKNKELACNNRPLNVLVYEEDSVVYFWDDAFNEFQILYDLKKQVNESWFVKVKALNQSVDTVFVNVLNTGSFFLNGTSLKTMTVQYSATYHTNNIDFSQNSKIIENIGDTIYMFYYPTETTMFCDMNYSGGLRCYEDDFYGVYSNGNSPTCEYDNLGIETFNKNSTIILYPNPSNSHFQLNGLQENINYKISISDQQGRILKVDNIINNSSIDISELKKGNYFVHLQDSNKNSINLSLIKVAD